MKKGIIIASALLSITSLANYKVLIKKGDAQYDIKLILNETGNERCASFSPLENEIYKDTSFQQIGTNCEKEQLDQYGKSHWTPIPDKSYDKLGTLVLKNCLEIMDQKHSRGNDIYKINQGGQEFDVYCNMTLENGGWTLVGTMADDGNNYWYWNNRNVLRDGSTYGNVIEKEKDYQSMAWNKVSGNSILLTPTNESKYLRYDSVLTDQPLKDIYPSSNIQSKTYEASRVNGSWWIDTSCDNGKYYMRTMTPDSDAHGWNEASAGFVWMSNNNEGCSWDDTFGGLMSGHSSHTTYERGWINTSDFYHKNFDGNGMFIFVK